MIHLVLDTTVYRSNPSRNNLHFQAIEKLSKSRAVCLYIPYIVMREFQTQQREIYSKDIKKANSGLSSLSEKALAPNIIEKLKILTDSLESESENILSDAENQLIQWAKNIGANLYPLCIEQTNAALEAYFQGNPPFKVN